MATPAKDKEKEKDKGKGTDTPPAPPAETPVETEKAKRSRQSFGKDKQLAYLLTGLVGILESEAVSKALTTEQLQKIATAKTKANEIGGDPLKPVTDRIAAIQGELRAFDFDQPNALAKHKELALDLDRQAKKKAQIEEMIGKAV